MAWLKSEETGHRTLRVACLSFALLLPTCVVSGPPDYEAPQLERPNLHILDATPPTTQIKVVQRGESLTFVVPVDIVPATEAVKWQLWANFDLQTEKWQASGALKDGDKEIRASWTQEAEFEAGCLQLTLLVAHESSLGSDFQSNSKHEIVENRRGDVSIVTWWVSLAPALGEERSLLNCPPSPNTSGK